jgi:hypothetical protein
MTNIPTKPRPVKFAVHVHAYLWFAWFLVSASPIIIANLTTDSSANRFGASLKTWAMVAAIQIALWFTRERCAAPGLSWWDGLLYITGFMTIGIGRLFGLISIFMALFGILGSFTVAVVGFLRGDDTFAPAQFRRLVMFASRNRMFQPHSASQPNATRRQEIK